MRRLTIILIAGILSLSTAWSVDFESLMFSGNKYYEQGNFDKAIAEYKKIISADGVSPVLYYNLGCAYFSLEDYGRAILYFEKARQLDPRDPDIQHNLEFTKLFLKDRFDLPEPMPLVEWFSALWQSLSLTELRLLETVLFILMILSLIAYRLLMDQYSGREFLMLSALTGILFILSIGWLWNRASVDQDKMAVLLVSEANISSAPVPGSSTLFVIHTGTTAEILNTTDSWYEIRLLDGKTGWIQHEAIGIY